MRTVLDLSILLVLFLAMVGELDASSVVIGLFVSAAALRASRTLARDTGAPRRPRRARRGAQSWIRFVLATAREVVRGSWRVGARALGVVEPRPGLVEVPVADRDLWGICVVASAETLSPGSFLVEIDRERGVLRFHVIDVADRDRVRRAVEAQYALWEGRR